MDYLDKVKKANQNAKKELKSSRKLTRQSLALRINNFKKSVNYKISLWNIKGANKSEEKSKELKSQLELELKDYS